MADPLSTLPLSAIRVFEAAARQLSFTRAAEELGITQAAVSWQVKALERRLDQVLFERLPKEVVLTPPGARLAKASSEAMSILRAAVSDLTDTGEHVLALTTTGSFATQWLAPRIGAFQIAHPRIAVRVEATARRIDLMRENFDAAVRPGSGDWPNLESVFLFPAAVTPLCTPAFAARHGGLGQPQDLLAAQLVGLPQDWSDWFEAAGVDLAEGAPHLSLVAKQQTFEVASALMGNAAALASPVYFASELRDGRLVQPFDIMLHFERGYWLAYRKERRRAPKIVALREWLLETIANDPVTRPHTAPGQLAKRAAARPVRPALQPVE
jgi:LysR family glycine cleavage system transcriptional activator